MSRLVVVVLVLSLAFAPTTDAQARADQQGENFSLANWLQPLWSVLDWLWSRMPTPRSSNQPVGAMIDPSGVAPTPTTAFRQCPRLEGQRVPEDRGDDRSVWLRLHLCQIALSAFLLGLGEVSSPTLFFQRQESSTIAGLRPRRDQRNGSPLCDEALAGGRSAPLTPDDAEEILEGGPVSPLPAPLR